MKRMTGTVTLSLLEEDNRQRILFRLIPLCTREGIPFENAKETFSDEGSLRIVPDKHEQSTFKDRMRSLSGYCAVIVPSDGREQMKIRQNRNYAPQNGECNQFALYSDVVYEFAPGACFEVIPYGETAADAITDLVLVQHNKMLYGPVAKEQLAQIDMEQAPLFGNEAFLLHTIQSDVIGKRTVCWNPDAVMNWRQRRAEQRRTEREAEAAKPDAVDAAKPIPTETDSAKPQADEKHNPKPERAQRRGKAEKAQKAAKAPEAAVPAAEATKDGAAPAAAETAEELLIGEKLTILDSSVSFEQQLSQLAQPISTNANLLNSTAAASTHFEEVEEEPREVSHFNSTPFTGSSEKPAASPLVRTNVPAVVEKQLRQQRGDKPAASAGNSLYSAIDNPVEAFSDTLDILENNEEMRAAAIRVLMKVPSLCTELVKAMQSGGLVQETEAAALEQLDEIEAERLALLMQLKQVQENERKYRDEVFLSIGQKKRSQLIELNHRIHVAEETEKKLQAINQTLSEDIQAKLKDCLNENAVALGSVTKDTVAVSPAIGENYSFDEIIDRIRIHMNSCGYSISDDEAASLATTFAIEDHLILEANNETDGVQFAVELVKCLGLSNCAAICNTETSLQLISLLRPNEGCTPTVAIQPVQMPALHAQAHKTISIAVSGTDYTIPDACPVLPTTKLTRKPVLNEANVFSPITFASFDSLARSSVALSAAAEQWLNHFIGDLKQEGILIPESVITKLRRFIAIGCQTMRGNFVSTADCSVAMWILPYLRNQSVSAQIIEQLTGFTRTLKLLQP